MWELRDSNDVEVLAILDALRNYLGAYQEQLIVDSDSLHAISWVKLNSSALSNWKSQFYFYIFILFIFSRSIMWLEHLPLCHYFNEIKLKVSSFQVDFHHVTQCL